MQVRVPKVSPVPDVDGSGAAAAEESASVSVQTKRFTLQRKAAATIVVDEDIAICFIGVHGLALIVEPVRCAKVLEIQLGLCSAKGVMVHTIAIVNIHHARMLQLWIQCPWKWFKCAVYRDSESIPMVCCDVCQRWVHCQCDGINDAKYLQFQVDGNLQYKCAACRGECYQVTDIEDVVQELWKRRDRADRDLTASLRGAAGLPTQEDLFSISPYSDDEENDPVMLKGLADKPPKKENIKKSSTKSITRERYIRNP